MEFNWYCGGMTKVVAPASAKRALVAAFRNYIDTYLLHGGSYCN